MPFKIQRTDIRDILTFSALVVALLWIILITSHVLPLQALGIWPRQARGLIGIPFAPFLHANGAHLSANTGALLVFGWICFALEGKRTLLVTALIILFGGLGTWLIGDGRAIHLGASGLIYGLFGYILSVGIVTKQVLPLLVGILVFLLYGGMLWGVLPSTPGISWESHLCGFVAGVGTAAGMKRKTRGS